METTEKIERKPAIFIDIEEKRRKLLDFIHKVGPKFFDDLRNGKLEKSI